MIVVLKAEVEREGAQAMMLELQRAGLTVSLVQTGERYLIDAIGLPDHEAHGFAKRLRANPQVDQVLVSGAPIHLVAGGGSRPILVGDLAVGGNEITVMAGPCTIESEEQIHRCAEAVARAGATVLRGGAYKPSTSPYGFQGHGVIALGWMRDAARASGLKMVTEVMDTRRVAEVAEYADILQIGARNMQNFDLLREVGRSTTPVLLKRGMSARLDEWLLAAEHIAKEGNEQIILCERGIRSFDTFSRNTLDLGAVIAAKKMTHLPVIVDPSHAAGRRDLVDQLSLAAIAAGADGLIIEVHPDPAQAQKDGAQSLTFADFDALAPKIQAVALAVGRTQRAAQPARP